MPADQQDMINHLMAQLATQPQGPSLYGLQAQADPNSIAALIGKMKQQQVLDQANAPTQGQYGYLHDAGKAAFNSIGSNLGGQLAAFGNGPQQSSPVVAAQKAAISQGNQANAADLASGTDPLQAKINALQKAVQSGIPGASDALDKAVEAQQKNITTAAQAKKDNAQADSALDEISNRAAQQKTAQDRLSLDTDKDTWSTIGQGNGYAVQRNAKGEMRSIKISDAASSAASGIDPAALQRMVDEKLTTGKDPAGLSKAGLLVPYQNALAARLSQTGDTQGAANARAVALKSAASTDKTLGTQVANTQTAGLQIEKNIDSLKPVVERLGGIGSPVFQKALNQWNQGLVGDKDTAQAIFYINELQSEMARIASNTFGNAPLSDSAKADAKELINKSMIGTGSMDGVFMASRKSYLNKLDSLNESRATNRSYLTTNAPGSPFAGNPRPTLAAAETPAEPTAPTARTYNPKTGLVE